MVTISLLTFCLEDISIDVKGVLTSLTMTVLLLISPVTSIKIFFLHLDVPILGTYMKRLSKQNKAKQNLIGTDDSMVITRKKEGRAGREEKGGQMVTED